MSVTVAPSASFEATLDVGTTGLVNTLSLGIYDGDTATQALATTSINEIGTTGVYVATRTAPTVAGQYVLVWSLDGTLTPSKLATEDLVVTGNAAVAVSSGNEYTTLAELKATLNIPSGTTLLDDDLAAAIQAASRAIDNHCGQRFYLDSAATVVRYYDALDGCYVRIDPCASVATVAIDQTGSRSYTAITAYELAPYNAALESKPYTALETTPTAGVRFPATRRGVKVTAQWGWPSVPGPVTEACTILASRLHKRSREAPFGVAGFGIDGNAIRISRMDPDVAMLLDPYSVRRMIL